MSLLRPQSSMIMDATTDSCRWAGRRPGRASRCTGDRFTGVTRGSAKAIQIRLRTLMRTTAARKDWYAPVPPAVGPPPAWADHGVTGGCHGDLADRRVGPDRSRRGGCRPRYAAASAREGREKAGEGA